MVVLLRVVFSCMLVYMSWTVIDTSLRSNLFEEWNFLASIPWMEATLKDFYANVLFIFVWVAYKERHWLKILIWFVALVCLGSIATALYVLIQLFRMKQTDSLDRLFVRTNPIQP